MAIVGEGGNTLGNLYIDIAGLIRPRVEFQNIFVASMMALFVCINAGSAKVDPPFVISK